MLFAESEIIDLGNTNQRMKGIREKMRNIMGKGETFFHCCQNEVWFQNVLSCREF